MERESGYYWIKLRNDLEWDIAEYYHERNAWYISGFDKIYYDEEFDEIDERRIERKDQ